MNNQQINKSTTLKDAMKALNENIVKCLMVVDRKNKFVGTVTDGDIRRGILDGLKLSSSILKCTNLNPITFNKKNSNKDALKFFADNDISLIPVLNDNGIVVDYFSSINENEKDNKRILRNISTVIMAGGKGTRMEPFTSILPKPLIPIKNKPIIEHIIEKFYSAGSNKFYISTNYKSKLLKAYFYDTKNKYSIEYLDEKKPLGTAGSLRLLEKKTRESFFVTNCDILVNLNYADLYDFHQTNNYELTIVASLSEFSIPYGTLKLLKNGDLQKIDEKPNLSYLINTGLYILKPSVLELIPKNKLFDMTDLIKKIKSKGKSIGVYPINEDSWSDVGEWNEFKKTERKFTVR